MKKTLSIIVAVSAMFTSIVISAQPLVTSKGVAVTVQDLNRDVKTHEGDDTPNPLKNTDVVKQTISNMLVRRMLSQQAVQEGLEKDPQVSIALQHAREKVLSDAKLAKLDEANRPSPQVAEGYARSVYQANTKKFEVPEELNLSHIFVKEETPDAKQKAERWLQALTQGANFAELATQESEDQGTASKGGDLGVVRRGRMVPTIEQAAFALGRIGQFSGIVKSPFGYHILLLTNKKPARTLPFDEIKERLIKESQAAIVNEARNKLQAKLLEDAAYNEAAIQSFADSLK